MSQPLEDIFRISVCPVNIHPEEEISLFYVEAVWCRISCLMCQSDTDIITRGSVVDVRDTVFWRLIYSFLWEAGQETHLHCLRCLCSFERCRFQVSEWALTLWKTVSGLWSSSPLLVTGISAAELLWDSSAIVLSCNEEGEIEAGYLEEFSQHNFKERREVHGRIEDSGATCGTTVVGCHLVDTDIVDFSDLGHDSTLRITCGITVMTWYCDIRWNNTDIYDFDLMTLLVFIYKKQCDKHCADKIKEDYDETDFLLLFYPRKSLKGTCLCSYETHLF